MMPISEPCLHVIWVMAQKSAFYWAPLKIQILVTQGPVTEKWGRLLVFAVSVFIRLLLISFGLLIIFHGFCHKIIKSQILCFPPPMCVCVSSVLLGYWLSSPIRFVFKNCLYTSESFKMSSFVFLAPWDIPRSRFLKLLMEQKSVGYNYIQTCLLAYVYIFLGERMYSVSDILERLDDPPIE